MMKAFFVGLAFGFGALVLIVSGAVSAEQKKARVFKDPFAYCTFAGTIEAPGPSYRGPESPPEVERIVGGLATFRCRSGQVLGCALGASGLACMKKDLSRTPNADLVSYCRAQPNSDIDYATQGYSAYEWRCRGRTPQIVSGPSADATGFIPDSWQTIHSTSATQPAATVGSNPRPTAKVGANQPISKSKFPISLQIKNDLPASFQVTDLNKNGQEILAMTAVISSPRTMSLPLNLQCRNNVDNRHVLIEAFAEGKRFVEAVKGNFCDQNDDGDRVIVVYLTKINKKFPDADRFNAYQDLVHAE